MTTAPATSIDTEAGRQALEAARRHQDSVVQFLRDMIAIRAESGTEKERCERVKAEYEKLGFDEAWFDGLGTVVARIGNGPLKILMDGHIDCVGVGDPASWDYDPFQGKLEGGRVYGRGAVDELPSIACMAYGAKMLMERGVPPEVTLYLSASVYEEDLDGHCLLNLIEKEGLWPDVVVIGEPTDMDVYRGHRGRMEMTITTKGVAAHGAHAHRGVNALYKAAPIILDVEKLNETLKEDPFLGKGSIIVSYVDVKTPSMCAVPDRATIYLDRRLTAGETIETALAEVQALPHLGDAQVAVREYDGVAWTGKTVHQEAYFPTWVLPEDHALVRGTVAAVEAVRGTAPKVSRWHFSTNGVASMGRLGIPSVGFAPGLEELAHSTGEWVAVEDLVKATAAYSLMPAAFAALAPELKRKA
jgi:putative selenium metabolism hydrolase